MIAETETVKTVTHQFNLNLNSFRGLLWSLPTIPQERTADWILNFPLYCSCITIYTYDKSYPCFSQVMLGPNKPGVSDYGSLCQSLRLGQGGTGRHGGLLTSPTLYSHCGLSLPSPCEGGRGGAAAVLARQSSVHWDISLCCHCATGRGREDLVEAFDIKQHLALPGVETGKSASSLAFWSIRAQGDPKSFPEPG
jgi:hypothetical protein